MNRILILLFAISTLLFSCEQKKTELSEADLEGKSLSELRILRNEIFARHGYIFKSQDLKEHFSKTDWYNPQHSDVNHLLTEQDKSQIELILKREALLKADATAEPKERVKLTTAKFKKDSVNDVQKEAITNYLNTNKSKIVDDFNRFWGKDLGIKSYKFKIIDQSVFSKSEESILSVKLEVKGQGDNFSAIAYNNYLLSTSASPSKVYETTFFQPECGTPDYSIIGVTQIDKINNYKMIDLETEIAGCCGASDKHKVDWLLFNNDFGQLLDTLHLAYLDKHDDHCSSDSKIPETRETIYYYGEGSELVARTNFYDGGELQKTENKTIKLD
ncbi:YARHG domain-containing protein [Reichenbachiella agariperforans]|uniref:YARHG domain-containing protein n=1 Tax=Reichenbachiella agariperforans TaxID=156994 RepID=UPI001C0A024E|nr:YARHG domain-containing protein [Reichenbachiella agariperforans]MBU2914857.1 YARHG domain-containing protein [Reichenbachiella agariperforans]